MQKSLFGYGKTTKALAQKFGGFHIYDDTFKEPKEDEFNNILLNPSYFNPALSELEIMSPGFPPEHKLIKEARNLTSEYDYFYDVSPKTVWISGTNGKTTTTQMSQHLLAKIGSQMGANVGIPLAELDPYARLWILETSSFTMHYTKKAKPELYALLPITQDHLSWHGTFKAYEEAKLSVLSRMNECDVAILPAKYKDVKTKAYLISYENDEDLALKMGIDMAKISFKTPFLLDAILALSIEKILLDSTSYELLNSFVILDNKLEEFKDKKQRLWVNDSKATNLDATKAALIRYKDKDIHLILGGDSKGVDLSPLFAFMKDFKIKLYLIGTSKKQCEVLAKEYDIKYSLCENLEDAVFKIDKSLNLDEVALLSPACASLDEFSSYAQRAELFKDCVARLS
ncbi:UDP-N-acetylmuramoyl-L-alanine--D-glutamate ligase [Campylobacter avium]|uniref:UDP-N-acetylmuramoyl-L-alanine--D-glutamate ligase n=1 Tax=Campylobacter avium TaxID=522485 RepID=UPI00255BB9EA|nr:UDP-N-acetylmuramoyl-L-alanine--D-glutamate ligase [Campylobacter avium]